MYMFFVVLRYYVHYSCHSSNLYNNGMLKYVNVQISKCPEILGRQNSNGVFECIWMLTSLVSEVRRC